MCVLIVATATNNLCKTGDPRIGLNWFEAISVPFELVLDIGGPIHQKFVSPRISKGRHLDRGSCLGFEPFPSIFLHYLFSLSLSLPPSLTPTISPFHSFVYAHLICFRMQNMTARNCGHSYD